MQVLISLTSKLPLITWLTLLIVWSHLPTFTVLICETQELLTQVINCTFIKVGDIFTYNINLAVICLAILWFEIVIVYFVFFTNIEENSNLVWTTGNTEKRYCSFDSRSFFPLFLYYVENENTKLWIELFRWSHKLIRCKHTIDNTKDNFIVIIQIMLRSNNNIILHVCRTD